MTVYEGSCFTQPWPDDAHWTVVWHDIWPTLDKQNLAEMDQLETRFAPLCDWQACWGKEYIQQRRDPPPSVAMYAPDN